MHPRLYNLSTLPEHVLQVLSVSFHLYDESSKLKEAILQCQLLHPHIPELSHAFRWVPLPLRKYNVRPGNDRDLR